MTAYDHNEPDERHPATDPPTPDASPSDQATPRKTSQRRIDANGLNAQRSTGPRTEEGKARSSQNAVRTGVYGSAVPVPRGLFREDPDAIAAYVEAVVASLKPKNAMALGAAHEVAAAKVRLARLERLEAEYMAGAARREEPGLEEQLVLRLERMAARMDADLEDLSPREWHEIASFLALDHGAEDIINLADPNTDGETLASGEPAWEYLGRELLDQCYDTPADFVADLRARATTARKASGRNDDEQLERAAMALIDDGPLEKCSLIRARLTRELDRALARFQAMQALPE